MKRTKKLLLAFLIPAVLAVAGVASCEKKAQGDGGARQSSPQIDRIRKADVLKVGVKSDVPKFGLLNTATNQYEGFEIELSRLIAKQLFGDPDKVAFTAVTAKTRGPLLDNGDIDLVIATFTITDERKLAYNFSTPYYTDAVGMLVKKAAGYTGLKDLNGKTIGVAQSATSREAIKTAADSLGISVTFMEFSTYPEIKAALDSGRIDVFSVDKSILNGYLDSETEILPDAFSPQDYGVASKFANKDVAAYVESLITNWLNDGTIKGLINQFGL
ncbi:MAG: transporter substrate-binding domain-containing protein [Treponema sp.]|jgi:putative glutamine transport system substrate-binding protein|nr:transporter substrate-binding domain-containing protein [Treponema sp.]